MKEIGSALWRVMRYSVWRMSTRPIFYVGFFVLPMFMFFFLTDLMKDGLPTKVPAAIVDKDGTSMSRSIAQNLAGMQLVDIQYTANSFTQAREEMQEGKIYGFFMIPENFEKDLLAGKAPEISFYTNMTYYVPASMLFKTFKSTSVYTKAGITMKLLESAGGTPTQIMPLIQPVNIISRPLHNPELNYAIYLGNSFVPCVLQLMIFLVTCYSLGQEEKLQHSQRLLEMADDSILIAVAGKLLPQTVVWWVVAIFMESELFFWWGYPMNGSWFWITVSELMFVLACQGFATFLYGIVPNLRFSLSLAALTGILSFSICAISFPTQSMYPAVAIMSYLVPERYNFLIYVNEALNGIPVYYSRVWYAAYIVFMIVPLVFMGRIKDSYRKMVYVP